MILPATSENSESQWIDINVALAVMVVNLHAHSLHLLFLHMLRVGPMNARSFDLWSRHKLQQSKYVNGECDVYQLMQATSLGLRALALAMTPCCVERACTIKTREGTREGRPPSTPIKSLHSPCEG